MRLAKEALAEGKCVVIGLQSTGEARTADVIAERGEELDDFVSGPKVRPGPQPTCWDKFSHLNCRLKLSG